MQDQEILEGIQGLVKKMSDMSIEYRRNGYVRPRALLFFIDNDEECEETIMTNDPAEYESVIEWKDAVNEFKQKIVDVVDPFTHRQLQYMGPITIWHGETSSIGLILHIRDLDSEYNTSFLLRLDNQLMPNGSIMENAIPDDIIDSAFAESLRTIQ
jgi:hypothetical protein